MQIKNILVCLHFLPAVLKASEEVLKSKKLRKMLELVLAFGNYMNRGQRGNAVGFKIGSLGKIHDTKSSVEKRTTLLHYLVDIVERKVKNGKLINLFIIAESNGLFMTIANCVSC